MPICATDSFRRHEQGAVGYSERVKIVRATCLFHISGGVVMRVLEACGTLQCHMSTGMKPLTAATWKERWLSLSRQCLAFSTI